MKTFCVFGLLSLFYFFSSFLLFPSDLGADDPGDYISGLTDPDMVVIDGSVTTTDEWQAALYLPPIQGFSSGTYVMHSNTYEINGFAYPGKFQYLLHNIEQLVVKESADYNKFEIIFRGQLVLTIWVFNEIDHPDVEDQLWIVDSGITTLTGLTSHDDRGFMVYNHLSSQFNYWTPDLPGPEGGFYDWNSYFGVHAIGGYDNSAYSAGLQNAIESFNELYEVMLRIPPEYINDSKGGAGRNDGFSIGRGWLPSQDPFARWLDEAVKPVALFYWSFGYIQEKDGGPGQDDWDYAFELVEKDPDQDATGTSFPSTFRATSTPTAG